MYQDLWHLKTPRNQWKAQPVHTGYHGATINATQRHFLKKA